MKIKTQYTPIDETGKVFRLPGVYTLADIQRLGTDLVSEGVQVTDALNIAVQADGTFTITVEKTL